MKEQLIINQLPYPKNYNGLEWNTKIQKSRKSIPKYLHEDLPKLKYQLLRQQFKQVSKFQCPKLDYFSKAMTKNKSSSSSDQTKLTNGLNLRKSSSKDKKLNQKKQLQKQKLSIIQQLQYAILTNDTKSNVLQSLVEKSQQYEQKISQIKQKQNRQKVQIEKISKLIINEKENKNLIQKKFNLPTLASTSLMRSRNNSHENQKQLVQIWKNRSMSISQRKINKRFRFDNRNYMVGHNMTNQKTCIINYKEKSFFNEANSQNYESIQYKNSQNDIANKEQRLFELLLKDKKKSDKQQKNKKLFKIKNDSYFRKQYQQYQNPQNPQNPQNTKSLKYQQRKLSSLTTPTLSFSPLNSPKNLLPMIFPAPLKNQNDKELTKQLYHSQINSIKYFPSTIKLVFDYQKKMIEKQAETQRSKLDWEKKISAEQDNINQNAERTEHIPSISLQNDEDKKVNKVVQKKSQKNKFNAINKMVDSIILHQFQ